jgi:hypothetical protein
MGWASARTRALRCFKWQKRLNFFSALLALGVSANVSMMHLRSQFLSQPRSSTSYLSLVPSVRVFAAETPASGEPGTHASADHSEIGDACCRAWRWWQRDGRRPTLRVGTGARSPGCSVFVPAGTRYSRIGACTQ